MMTGIREFLNTKVGKVVSAALVVLAFGVVAWSIKSNFSDPTFAAAGSRMFVCSETGKAFSHKLEIGEKNPIQSPYSGKATGYPAEACFWTADGHAKSEPTWVLLNQVIGKTGPTFCPDCGRLVVARNPAATDGDKPPPTKADYKPGMELIGQ